MSPLRFFFHVQHPHNLVRFQQFLSDAAAGTLPQVSFIDPAFSMAFGPETDEHPPAAP